MPILELVLYKYILDLWQNAGGYFEFKFQILIYEIREVDKQ